MPGVERTRPEAFSIRIAVLADAEAVAHVHQASRTAALRDHLPPALLHAMPVEERVARWQEWLVSPDAVTLVASKESRVVGFGTLAPSADEDTDPDVVGEMPTLYVHPDHWRTGIGGSLCEAIIDLARSRGYKSLILWTLEANEMARSFYESLGFTADGRKKPDPVAPSSNLLGIRFRLELGNARTP